MFKLVDEKKNVGKIIQMSLSCLEYIFQRKLKAAPHVGGTNQHKPKGI